MEIHSKVKEAEFNITDKIIIRYKKGYGFWILKETDNLWYSCTSSFRANSLAIGFKKQYGFGYDDLKPFFFTSFAQALSYTKKVDSFEYWEYNQSTHEKIMDTIMKKGRFAEILLEMVENKDELLSKLSNVYK